MEGTKEMSTAEYTNEMQRLRRLIRVAMIEVTT